MPRDRISSPAFSILLSSATTAGLSASRPLEWNACAYGPVCTSHTAAPMRFAASTCAGSASMNTETTMPAAGDAHHFVGCRHFEVEADVGELAQAPHVLVLDVAAVFAQVHRDAVGAAEGRFDGGPDRGGLVGAPRPPR